MTNPIHPHNGHILGQRVKSLRLARGLSQRQVGEALGMNPDYYSKIERGYIARPYPRTIQALATLFRVEPTRLDPDFVPPAETGASTPTPKPSRPTSTPRVSRGRPLDPLMVHLAEAVHAYDPNALAEAGRFQSELGLGSTDAVAVMLSDGALMLLRRKQDWADYLVQHGDLARLPAALDALAAISDPLPQETPHA